MINSSKAPRSTSKRKLQGFPRETCRTAFQSERNPNSKDCFIKLKFSFRHIDYCPHSSVVHLITDVKSKSLSDDNMPRCSEPDQRRSPDHYQPEEFEIVFEIRMFCWLVISNNTILYLESSVSLISLAHCKYCCFPNILAWFIRNRLAVGPVEPVLLTGVDADIHDLLLHPPLHVAVVDHGVGEHHHLQQQGEHHHLARSGWY